MLVSDYSLNSIIANEITNFSKQIWSSSDSVDGGVGNIMFSMCYLETWTNFCGCSENIQDTCIKKVTAIIHEKFSGKSGLSSRSFFPKNYANITLKNTQKLRIRVFCSCFFNIFRIFILPFDLKQIELVLRYQAQEMMANIANLRLSELIVCWLLYFFSQVFFDQFQISFKNHINLLIAA